MQRKPRTPDDFHGIMAGAAVRRAGRHEVLLTNPNAPQEPPKKEPEKNEEGGLAEIDWTAIPVGAEGSPPVEILVLHWPSLRAANRPSMAKNRIPVTPRMTGAMGSLCRPVVGCD